MYRYEVRCTLFSVSEAELQEATGDLPAFADGNSRPSISVTTSPVGLVLELGEGWQDVHAALGAHPVDHPLGFLAGGGELVPSMQAGPDSGRCFMPAATIELLARVARIDDPRVRRLRQFLADAVLAKHGVIVHQFR